MQASKVYLVFWGTEWQNGFTSGGYTNIQIIQYIQNFFGNIGGSSWLDSVTQYSGLTNPVNQLAGSWLDASAVPASPTHSDISNEASVAWFHFPNGGDLTGAYLVFTPPGKSESGFNTSFCAYHDWTLIYGRVRVAYANMPFQPDGSRCYMNSANSQNDGTGHGYLDGFSIVGGHEYGEALTDPLVNAWQDNSLQENGDKCSGDQFPTFGNIALGSGYYAVQGLWSNADSACSLGGKYNPIAPNRILDTRSGIGGRSTPIGAGETFYLQVTGSGGVPARLVSAVVLNVTITNPTAPSYLTVYPAGTTRPIMSNINYVANQTVPNLVTARVGSGGQVAFFNAAGTTNVIADVQGWVSQPGPSSAAGLYQPLSTSRILDTRNGTGGYWSPFSPLQTRFVQVTGVAGVPSAGVSAVVLNVVATNQTAAGYLTVWPDGSSQPAASNVNFLANKTAVNRVIVAVSNGWIDIYNSAAGSVDVIADINGYFGVSGSYEFVPLNPARVYDSRNFSPFAPQETRSIAITDQGGVPKAGGSTPPTGVVINVTVTNPTVAGYLVIWPDDGSGMPSASDNNFYPNTTEANLDVVKLMNTSNVRVFNAAGSANVIIDVMGYYLLKVP